MGIFYFKLVEDFFDEWEFFFDGKIELNCGLWKGKVKWRCGGFKNAIIEGEFWWFFKVLKIDNFWVVKIVNFWVIKIDNLSYKNC